MKALSRIHIVGAGLIGTSMALGLKKAGFALTIEDEDPTSETLAQSLINQSGGVADPEMIIVATPILAIPALIKEFGDRYPEAILVDIGGLKSDVLEEVEKFPELISRFCSTHPMAGREVSGPASARGDLFEGRIWIYTPGRGSSLRAIESALQVISALGGVAIEMSAQEHDEAIAGISHLPQVVSSLLSATLSEISDRDIGLAGQGLKDVSRLAASNSELWGELLHANRAAVVNYLRLFANQLEDLSTSLQNDDLRKTMEILRLGRENHARIPGKHGGRKRDYWYLPIVIDDRPGQLAKIFDSCAVVGANVEDLSIEHTPGQESGLVTLALSKTDAIKVYDQLLLEGWKVHQLRETMG